MAVPGSISQHLVALESFNALFKKTVRPGAENSQQIEILIEDFTAPPSLMLFFASVFVNIFDALQSVQLFDDG